MADCLRAVEGWNFELTAHKLAEFGYGDRQDLALPPFLFQVSAAASTAALCAACA
jgi:hypothetical protein